MKDKKPNFSELTRLLAIQSTHGFCAVDDCINAAVDFHHRLANTKLNNKKFPLFTQSIFNCFIICRDHHDNYSLLKNVKITEVQAEAYEQWLRQFRGGI